MLTFRYVLFSQLTNPLLRIKPETNQRFDAEQPVCFRFVSKEEVLKNKKDFYKKKRKNKPRNNVSQSQSVKNNFAFFTNTD